MDYQQLPPAAVAAMSIGGGGGGGGGVGIPANLGGLGGLNGGNLGNTLLSSISSINTNNIPASHLQQLMQNNSINNVQIITSMQPPPPPPPPSSQPQASVIPSNVAGAVPTQQQQQQHALSILSNGNTISSLQGVQHAISAHNNNNNNNSTGTTNNTPNITNNNNNNNSTNNNTNNNNNNNNSNNNNVQNNHHSLPPPSHLLQQLHHHNNNNNNNNNNNASTNNNNNNNIEDGNRWTQFQVQQLWRHHAYLNGKSGNNKDICGDDKYKEDGDPWNVEAQAAFLGPNLWDKTLPYDTDLKVTHYADLDEFLSENNIPDGLPGTHLGHSTGLGGHRSDSLGHSTGLSIGLGHITTKRERSPSPSDCVSPDTINPPSPAESTFSFASSGRDFDPRTRAFSDEELKPQPMIKKSRKQFVPDELKDDKYWARRRKNNIAAKRSRDARRQKENQIAMRARYLEKEILFQNSTLHQELEQLKQENMELRARLSKYQDV